MAFEVAFRQLTSEHKESLPHFKCGRDSLNAFLCEDAVDFHEHGLTHTTLVYVAGDNEIAAYFSLSSDAVRLTTSEEGDLGLPFYAEIKYFPAVKITKFAVHEKYRRNGMGLQLLDAIQGLVYADGSAVATRILTVDALNEEDVLAFYAKGGFIEGLMAQKLAQGQKRETILMYRDIFAA